MTRYETEHIDDINMEEKKVEYVPALFFNHSEEGGKALRLVMDSGIKVHFGETDDKSPLLVVGFDEYVGYNKIKEYIEKIKNLG
ncbi:MAG: hypothetical protein J7L08_04330 [Candidatus Aenigmarchaeota archaeon]|nr:hypothetical protein [Candidatus Aenigmarchaeota archaeon]